MTNAHWAGKFFETSQNVATDSGIAIWVKRSIKNTWHPVCASSKEQNMFFFEFRSDGADATKNAPLLSCRRSLPTK